MDYNLSDRLQKKLSSLLRSRTQRQGYGLALLLIFVASTLLIGTSMSLILSPSVASYFNTSSIDSSSAQQLALMGLNAAQNDIFTQMNNGTTITTSYRYPTSGSINISTPTYPGSGANTTIGSYYVTVSKARGFTYLLVATATVNNNTTNVSKLIQMNISQKATFYSGYSLRKLFTGYSGNAVQVRCASTSQTIDIGFSGSDFDIAGFTNSCLGDTQLPLDTASGTKAAYSLRLLTNSYSGKAINVRSSAGGSQDIGFNASGHLDITALTSFIGNNTGYIATWYDQSGNGFNITQTTNAKQPRIVNAGVLDTQNGTPSVYFGGSQSLSNTSISGFSGAQLRAFIVAEAESSTNVYGKFVVLLKSGDSNSSSTSTSIELLAMANSATKTDSAANGGYPTDSTIINGRLFQSTIYDSTSNSLKIYHNGTLAGSDTAALSLAPTSIALGTGFGSDATTYIKGYISELIINNTNLTVPQQTAIEKNQGHYYQVLGMQDGFVTKWYDQSGNGRDVSQSTTANQPTINTSTARAGIFFNGTSNYLDNSTFNRTTNVISAFSAAQVDPNNSTGGNGRICSIWTTGQPRDYDNVGSSALMMKFNTNFGNARQDDLQSTASLIKGPDFQLTTLFNGTNRTIRYKQVNNTAGSDIDTNNATANLVINTLRIGSSVQMNGNEFWPGNIYEVWLYDSALNSTDYTARESDIRTYYGI